MKPIYVVIDAKTGEFFNPKKNSRYNNKRSVQAYTSEAKALAAMSQFWPRPDPEDYKIKRFVPGVETR